MIRFLNSYWFIILGIFTVLVIACLAFVMVRKMKRKSSGILDKESEKMDFNATLDLPKTDTGVGKENEAASQVLKEIMFTHTDEIIN